METIIRKIKGSGEDEGSYREAVRFLRQGLPVAFPTETVYGLGANGLDDQAAMRIYAAKGRPSDNPLILHIAEREELLPLVKEIPPAALTLMEAFWPGPLTLIFRKSDMVPSQTTGGLPTVAVRMPSHPVARELIRRAAMPIAAPSANASGRPSPTSADHVYADLQGRIPMILDGGETQIGLESTIVDVSRGLPEILRPGYIGREKLRTVLVGPLQDAYEDSPLDAPRAPGMKYKHYAPQVPITLVKGEDEARAAFICERARDAETRGRRIGVLVSRETAPLYQKCPSDHWMVLTLGARKKDEEIAHHLFSTLRSLDSYGLDHVYSETFENGPLSEAIMNRLSKAAAFDMIDLDNC